MSIAETSVRRPVSTMMVFLAIILLGGISWLRLPQELFPSMNYPQLTVVTHYGNAAPQEIESLVTKVLEEGVGTVPGVKRIRSASKEGTSLVFVEFQWGSNMDFASLAIREKIDMVKDRLPNEATEPFVVKFNPFELPVMILSITGNRSPQNMLAFTKKFIKDEIEKVDGVASASTTGGLEREIRVDLDQGRMQYADISILKLAEALKRSNLNYPAGNIEERFYEYLIRTVGEFETVDEIGNMVVGVREIEDEVKKQQRQMLTQQGKLLPPYIVESRFIRLKDIAKVSDTVKEQTSVSRYNGQENLSLAVQKQTTANVIQTAAKVKERLAQLAIDFPKDIQYSIIYDQSAFIRESINDVKNAGLFGSVMVFFVLWIFLRDLKASLVATTALPVAITATLMLMYFKGMSVNMMSLLGISLGVGDVVDSGIVVTEHRDLLRREGVNGREASIRGASEMTGAIMSSRLTSIAVFLPTLFIVGISGILFKELGLSVTFSLLSSVMVAVSLVPCLMARGERDPNREARSGARAGARSAKEPMARVTQSKRHWMEPVEEWYERSLHTAVSSRGVVVTAVMVLFAVSLLFVTRLPKEFMPKVDEGQFIIAVTMPTGTKLEVTDKALRAVERELSEFPEVESVSVLAGSERGGGSIEALGSHQGQAIVTLAKRRSRSSKEVIDELKDRVDRLALVGTKVDYIMQESVLATGSSSTAPVLVQVKGNEQRLLEDTAIQIEQVMLRIPGLYGVKQDVPLPQPEVKVNVRKDKATLFHLSVQDIALTAHAALKGLTATKFKEAGKEVDVTVRLKEEDRSNLARLRGLVLSSPLEVPVLLSDVAYVTKGLGPSQINRSDQQRIIEISANVSAGYMISDMMGRVQQEISTITEQLYVRHPSRPVTVSLTGEREQMEESFRSLRFAMALAILLVYMIMASQFESFWQPFVVMFTMPLGLIGVVLVLVVTQTPVSVVVLLGAIMLAGNVVNNGILLVDSINQELQHSTRSFYESVYYASKTRLRPILMTTLTTIVGYLPLAVSKTMMAPLAMVSIGGMSVSMMLTLWFIPALYVMATHLLRVPMPSPAMGLGPTPQLAVAGDVGVSFAPIGVKFERRESYAPLEEREEQPDEETGVSTEEPSDVSSDVSSDAVPPVVEESEERADEAGGAQGSVGSEQDAQRLVNEHEDELSKFFRSSRPWGVPSIDDRPREESRQEETPQPQETAREFVEPAGDVDTRDALRPVSDAPYEQEKPSSEDTQEQPVGEVDEVGETGRETSAGVDHIELETQDVAAEQDVTAFGVVPPSGADVAEAPEEVVEEDEPGREEEAGARQDAGEEQESAAPQGMLPLPEERMLLEGPHGERLLLGGPESSGESGEEVSSNLSETQEPVFKSGPPLDDMHDMSAPEAPADDAGDFRIPDAVAPVQQEHEASQSAEEGGSEPTESAGTGGDVMSARPADKGASAEPMPLNRRQERLLSHLGQVKRITRKEYSEIFGISVPTAARDLKDLLDRGLVRAKGPLGPGRWYELSDERGVEHE